MGEQPASAAIRPPALGRSASALSVRIAVDAVDVVSYALAHNRISVAGSLSLVASQTLRGAEVRVRIADAQGDLSRPSSWPVDLERDRPTVLRRVPLQLDPAAMSQVEEQRPGVLAVEVVADGVTVAAQQHPLQVLAANQWLRSSAPVTTELLAAFVQPNHPAVAEFLGEVAEVLRAETGSASLEGYQSGEDRVDQIVRAVATAAQRREIRYAEPPASWSDRGQKVRTPGEVLQQRVGTCLDTTVTLAAVLEQAGIRPLIFLARDHCFLGYWRQEAGLQSIVESDLTPVVNLVDLGSIGLLETTVVTRPPLPDDTVWAQRAPYERFFRDSLEEMLAVVDIAVARANQVLPLPAVVRRSDQTVEVFEYRPPRPAEPSGPRIAEAIGDGPRRAARADTPARVQRWKNALLDLTLRNRLINASPRQSVGIGVPGESLPLLEDLVNGGRQVRLLPRDRIDDVHRERGLLTGWELPAAHRTELLKARIPEVYCDIGTDTYATRWRNIAYKARTIVEETGANNLYLALGSLLWTREDRQLRSPLILVPVTLAPQSRGGLYQLALDESGTSVPNFCLLEKLYQEHGVRLPALAQPAEDEAGIDLTATFRDVRLALAEAGLPYRVLDEAYLSIFQFAKFRLWKDLDEHWQAFAGNALVRHLLDNPSGEFLDPDAADPEVDLDELAAECPVPADASQLAAVADALAGRSFVLEGPPGTGKSQTITNLLGQAMRKGRRILFVAEKRAALDVVRRRLEDVGLGTFSLDLHDKSSKPSRVREQILAALDALPQVDHDGVAAEEQSLRAARSQLARYARQLHATNGAGLSYYAARNRMLALADGGEVLPVPRSLVAEGTDPAVVADIRARLRRLPETADLTRPRPHHPWGMVRASAEQTDLSAVRQAAVAMDRACAEWVEDGSSLGTLIRQVRTPGATALVHRLVTGPQVGLAVLDEVRLPRWRQATDAALADLAGFLSSWPASLAAQVEPSILTLPLAQIHAAALQAAASSWFGRKKRLAAVLEQLRPGLRPDAPLPSHRHLTDLTSQLAALAEQADQLAWRLRAIPGLLLPLPWHPQLPHALEELRQQVEWLTWASRMIDPTGGHPLATRLRDYVTQPAPDDAGRVSSLAEAVAHFAALVGAGDHDFIAWLGPLSLVEGWQQTSAGRELDDPELLALRRWLAFHAQVAAVAAAGLPEAAQLLRSGEVGADVAPLALERGMALASQQERLEATGLAAFDPVAHDRAVVRFSSSAARLRHLQTFALPHAIVSSRSFDGQQRAGNVGGLRRELARQRGGLGVRGLLERYGELITSVMPCVLVSPDSLARFFPPRAELFDLVVFDEASQIRVADAIGAMGRARSVVVVGDSRQMPPTSFAETVLDDEELATDVSEVLAVPDEESILSECVQSGVPRTWLSWHYRSQDESLIAFSNALYYEDRLSTFPAPRAVPPGPGEGVGVSLVRVDGRFLRSGAGRRLRTNPVEAEAIVAEIRRRFAEHPPGSDGLSVPSLGVVTFNAPQRALVEELLRDCGDARITAALDASDGLFVKNLENVQGDERDVILFSTAFSVNDRGVLPLNFGPLNQAGGERRLNVAVTRARRQVIVYSSFDPEQLRAEQTSARGIKDLRTYLDLAASGSAVLDSLAIRTPQKAPPDRHREELVAALRARGWSVDELVGLSEFRVDLALRSPSDPRRYAVGVLLDGPAWASRRTVGDRDGLPVEVLSNLMHWPGVERVWLPHWLRDPDAVLDSLSYAVERAEEAWAEVATSPTPPVDRAPSVDGHGPRAAASGEAGSVMLDPTRGDWHPADAGPGVSEGGGRTEGSSGGDVTVGTVRSSATTPVEDAAEESSLRGGPSGEAAWGPPPGPRNEGGRPDPPSTGDGFIGWGSQGRGDRTTLDQLHTPWAAQEVRRVIEEIVAAEGPVHLRRLARLAAGAFGLTRVSEERAQAIIRLVPPELLDRSGQPFVWPRHVDRTAWGTFRRQTSLQERPLEQISLREIGNAMVGLARAAAGLDPESLLRETYAVFGGSRLTEGARQRLNQALELSLSAGRLRLSDGFLVVPAEPSR